MDSKHPLHEERSDFAYSALYGSSIDISHYSNGFWKMETAIGSKLLPKIVNTTILMDEN